MAKVFKGSMKPNQNFLGGWGEGGLKLTKFPWKGYGYFVEQHNAMLVNNQLMRNTRLCVTSLALAMSLQEGSNKPAVFCCCFFNL